MIVVINKKEINYENIKNKFVGRKEDNMRPDQDTHKIFFTADL